MFSNKNGMPAYKGYEYQIYITIRTALCLIFKEKKCNEIIIEPATEEDIAANLDVDSDKAITTLQLPLIKRPLEIQVKLRSGGPMDVSEFANILSNNEIDVVSRRSAPRKRPVQLLNEDAELMYLLITTSEVNKNLKPFVIENIGDVSFANTNNAPASIKALQGEIKDDLLKRIGILEQQVPKLLVFEIKEYLSLYCHVPITKHDECIAELVACVRDRLLGLKNKEWTENEIREVIYKHSGFPLVNKIMSSYVEPTNYLQIKEHLKKKNKLLIIGTPGVGKTLTADMIEYEYSISPSPYEVVKKEVGIGGIKNYLKKTGRYLFYLEDPWGYNSLSSEALAWMSELPKLLEQASEDKMFLITSRISILEQATVSKKSLELIKDDCISITQENYDKVKREKILLKKVIQLRPWQKDFISVNKNKILDRLTVPISLERFVALLDKESDESKVKIDSLIQKSLVESIHATVVEEISYIGEEAIASSIALWLLVATGEEITIENARYVRKAIREKYLRYELDIQKLIEWMECASWLYTKGHTYYMHPTTLSGIEEIVKQNSTKAEDIISNFLESLVEKNKQEFAYNIITRLKDRKQMIPNEVSVIITRYLINKLMCSSDAEFSQNFYRVALWSDGNDAITLIVRGLVVKDSSNKRNHGFERWIRPEWSDKQFNDIKTSKQANSIACNFIRIILPHTYSIYGEDLVDLFGKLGWDFSTECQELIEIAITESTINDELIIKIALMGEFPSYDKVLNVILNELSYVEKWWEDSAEEYNRALQAEFDFEHINHIIEEPSERFTPIENALKIVITNRRAREGYSWILSNPSRNELIKPWLQSALESQNLVSKEELETLVGICDADNLFLLWECIAKLHCKELTRVLLNALRDSPFDDLQNCLNALCGLLSAREVENILKQLSDLSFIRKAYLVMICRSMDFTGRLKYQDDREKYIQSVSGLLNIEELEFIDCLEKIQDNENIDINKAYIPYLKEWIKEVPNLYSSFAIEALAKLEYNIDDIAYDTIKNSEDYKTRVNVLIALANLKTEKAHEIIVDALGDIDYRVREMAIKILAKTASEEEKLAIIHAHTDKSAPVRETCAYIIGEMHWESGLDVLYTLLFDNRNIGGCGESRNFDNNTNFHVARASSLALVEFPSLPVEVVDKMIDFVKSGKKASDDIVVHYNLIEALSRQNHASIITLFEMFLENTWHMTGVENSGFPLRYAAIWGMLFHIIKFPEKIKDINKQSISKAANHSDERLAAPALIILGILNTKAIVEIRDVINQDEVTADRVILLIATFMVEGAYFPNELYNETLSHDYAGKQVLDFYLENELINDKKWSEFLNRNDEVKEWVNSVDNSKGIGPYLAFVINQLFNEKGYIPLKENEIRGNDLSENIGIMNTYSMMRGR